MRLFKLPSWFPKTMQALPTFFKSMVTDWQKADGRYMLNPNACVLGCDLEDFWENDGEGPLYGTEAIDQKRIRKGKCKLNEHISLIETDTKLQIITSCAKCSACAGFEIDKPQPKKPITPKKKEPTRGKKKAARK